MATTKSHLFLAIAVTIFTLYSLSLSSPAAAAATTTANKVTDKESVYELLPKFGLPSGLLPDSVTDYALYDDGRFVVDLEKPCYVQFDYLVYYETTITGKLSYGSITHLKGIQVQRLFLWFDVDEIRVDLPPSNNIYFQVGIINKKLNVDQFKTVHSCRNSLTSSPCRGKPSSSSSKPKLPTLVDEIPMLLTE